MYRCYAGSTECVIKNSELVCYSNQYTLWCSLINKKFSVFIFLTTIKLALIFQFLLLVEFKTERRIIYLDGVLNIDRGNIFTYIHHEICLEFACYPSSVVEAFQQQMNVEAFSLNCEASSIFFISFSFTSLCL